jgi:exopolyphosphatase/guanosine-5'-triphosphate,3'-diphosphate pyrophosphatase
MTRVAAVDLGTNSTRLLVADVNGGGLTEVSRRLTITRLGEGVDERRQLLPAPIARVRNCLVDYRRELESLGADRTLAIATSAVRDAENGEAFLGEIEWSYGFTTRLLSGEEEASLMLRGVTAGRAPLDDVLVVDIGGGSTELVLAARGDVAFSTSLDVGCVRVTERFLRSDPPTRPELAAAGAYVRSLLPALATTSAIGVAGTVTTLATLDLGDTEYDPERTHGHRLSAASVEARLVRLARLTTEQRAAVPGVEPGRASVIVAGAVILREILRTYGLGEVEVSERDILHGAALAAAELPETAEGAAPPGAYTCC